MREHFNKLSPAEDERLTLLAEECAEVIQAITKIQRHGYGSSSPLKPGSLDNRHHLARELGHLRAAQSLILGAGDVHIPTLIESAHDKSFELPRWLHHQGDL